MFAEIEHPRPEIEDDERCVGAQTFSDEVSETDAAGADSDAQKPAESTAREPEESEESQEPDVPADPVEAVDGVVPAGADEGPDDSDETPADSDGSADTDAANSEVDADAK